MPPTSRPPGDSHDRNDLELGLRSTSAGAHHRNRTNTDDIIESPAVEIQGRHRQGSDVTDDFKDHSTAQHLDEAPFILLPFADGTSTTTPRSAKQSSSTSSFGKSTTTPSSQSQSQQQQQTHTLRTDISPFEARLLLRWQRTTSRFLSTHPRLSRTLRYLQGPSPPITETSIRPFLPRVESYFDRLFHPIHQARYLVVPLFLIAWFLGFTFLVRSSSFNSSTSAGKPSWIGGTDSFWSKNAGCGINGTYCTSTGSLLFRCPAQTTDVELLNYYPVGSQEVIYEPLVVGGLDPLSTYRGDSWICPSAIHYGLFGNREGGCGQLEQVGEFAGFVGGERNGVKSVGFDSEFVSSYRFVQGVSQGDCKDIRDSILGFNVAMSTVMSFLIRPMASIFYWVLFCMGYWHVVLVSDPTSIPPNIETGFKYFLPALFIGYAFWRFSWRYVVPAFDTAVLEKTIWYLGGFWVGVLINRGICIILLLNKGLAFVDPHRPIDPQDIQRKPGGLVAVIVLAILLFLAILNQLRVIRRTGWFFFYLGWYVFGGVVIGLLLTLPDLEFRLHHLIVGILLMPGCAFVTRPSALFQGFLLGMFLDGAGRWGFDSILQSPASLVGDGTLGSDLPTFLTSAVNFTVGQTVVEWKEIPEALRGSWDSFAVIVDDVLRYVGTATNYTLAEVDVNLPHYLRIGYVSSGSYGDFTKAATAFVFNGTWIDPAAGAS